MSGPLPAACTRCGRGPWEHTGDHPFTLEAEDTTTAIPVIPDPAGDVQPEPIAIVREHDPVADAGQQSAQRTADEFMRRFQAEVEGEPRGPEKPAGLSRGRAYLATGRYALLRAARAVQRYLGDPDSAIGYTADPAETEHPCAWVRISRNRTLFAWIEHREFSDVSREAELRIRLQTEKP